MLGLLPPSTSTHHQTGRELSLSLFCFLLILLLVGLTLFTSACMRTITITHTRCQSEPITILQLETISKDSIIMKLLYSVLITSLKVASNFNSVAASAALRGEESRVEENAGRRNLKKKGMSLFDTAVEPYQKITPENAFLIKEAEDAHAGFEILFGGANPEGCEDTDTCLSGADPSTNELLREFSAAKILPWLKDKEVKAGNTS